METAPLQARRATLDDLGALLALWNGRGLPGDQLEKFLTEFQVVTHPDDGQLLGAIGLLTTGSDGLVHTEAISEDAPADEVRQAMWRRLDIVGRNQGIQRLWTQEDAAFWKDSGFAAATPEDIATQPAQIADPSAQWYLYRLVNVDRARQLANEQMAIWEASRLQERESLLQTISNVRSISLMVVALIIGVILLMAVYILLRRPDIIPRLLGR